jgi:N-acetylglutamate synthase-like GNAT family acetyltransferase
MSWQHMTADDLPAINSLSDQIHLNYPEDPEVFEERFRLYPAGCFMCRRQSEYVGYAITHPWMRESAPALNSLLGKLPDHADTYYLHDVALRPDVQRSGLGQEIVALIKGHARQHGFPRLSLVAVNNSTDFWRRQGFEVRDVPALREKLLSYDAAAAYMECPL